MSLFEQAEAAIFLLLSLVLSGLIGLERERRDKDAGLRTHILVGVGACLFTILSYLAFPGGDPTRIAANVITGISFVGGGIIYRARNQTRDVTTAAGIWVTAAIGMAVGAGAWFLAIMATVTTWITLAVLRYLPVREAEKNDKDDSP
ncbi:MAG: hypothetical protein OHK0046_03250 [Anaerolineae bacterium]